MKSKFDTVPKAAGRERVLGPGAGTDAGLVETEMSWSF
jgi:hypothetical protein